MACTGWAYTEWGDPANPRVLICVHGLTRNGRDFDVLANALASDYRVVCPDVVGRGRSDRMFFSDDYAVPIYANDMMTLIARLGVESVHWLGTSMGGLIGMFLSSLPGSPISRLVLNDVGPAISIEALQRIGEYLGKSPDFADLAAAEAYVRVVCAPFGALTDAQWRYMTVVGTRAKADGGFEMNYDRAIAEPYQKAFLEAKEINLWPMYEGIRCPTLVLRGAQSDILSSRGRRRDDRQGAKGDARRGAGSGTCADVPRRVAGAHRSEFPAVRSGLSIRRQNDRAACCLPGRRAGATGLSDHESGSSAGPRQAPFRPRIR
jgi:pimeloyl-ACP methyl ester carboxylesterase